MRLRATVLAFTAVAAVAGVAAPPASALPPQKSCGKIVVRLPAEAPEDRASGYPYTRGLTCHTAKVSARYVARRLVRASSWTVRRNTYDCDGSEIAYVDCVGIRPGDEDSTVAFLLAKRRRR